MKSNKIYEAINFSLTALAEQQTFNNISREDIGDLPMPSTDRLCEFVNLCREVIFPGYFADTPVRRTSLPFYMGVNMEKMAEKLCHEIYAGICLMESNRTEFSMEEAHERAEETTALFIRQIPELRRKLRGDVEAIFEGDPAATSNGEVIFAYPAIKAISNYRIAHTLYTLNAPLIPRVITEMAHSETGIDIHPHAQIGERFAIDHGTGIVIGATCIIGNNVKLYQGVTLGAKSFPLDANGNPVKGIPRHPILGNDVVVYAQATILGRIKIGDGSAIGGNVWLTHDVPPHSKIVQKGDIDVL